MTGGRARFLGAILGVFAFGSLLGASECLADDTTIELKAEATNGYSFDLFMPPGSGPVSPAVSLSEESDNGESFAFAAYRAWHRGHASRKRISADFGVLGSVTARFEMQSKRRHVFTVLGSCKEINSVRRGAFVGSIDFEGESGYSSIHKSRVRGTMRRTRSTKGCREQPSHHTIQLGRRRSAPSEPPASLRARADTAALSSCGPEPGTGLFAGVAPGGAEYGAGSDSASGGIRIIRLVYDVAGRDTFATHGKRATITPGGPYFDGVGRYRQGALSGDLTAQLPGDADHPLTPGEAALNGNDASLDCFPLSGD